MSLEGAKLICLSADDNGQFETIAANGKTFKFGYYMDCDVVLEHPDAMGLQCVINCDAFGRVTIENRCSDHPITLDGKTLVKMRPLLHNTEICIMDKKYLWQFDGNPEPRGFQMEDISDFTTPSKQKSKAQQPPNSEPARKWRRPLQTRLTIHSFAYCIKAGESPKDVEITTDENKPLNIHERIIDADLITNKRLSSPPPPVENIADFIDLNTPKIEQRSFSRKDQPLSCCKLSETVITSYSPRETGIRQEKSFALVQSPLTTSKVQIEDVSLGPFHHIISPQIIPNCRPSMHLIDLITPKKLIPPALSPARTLLKSTLKKNLPKGTSPQTPQKHKKPFDLSTPGSSDTVYSVRSTDDESVIILSDDCNASPSPIAKTPSRARTPQSLMKRAIISSAKKVAVHKKLLNLTGPKQTFTPITSKNPTAIRFQSQSTPQRKSLGRFPSSTDSLSAGKPRRSLVTSTPFRQRAEIVSTSSSKRSLLLSSSQSSTKKESRNSLMLKQALSMTPTTTIMNQKRKSVSCMKSQNKPRKSVSFLEQVEKDEQANVDEVEKGEVDQSLNHTFTIEEDSKNDNEFDQVATSHRKDATFSPEKVNCEEERGASKCLLQSNVSSSPEKLSTHCISTKPESVPAFNTSSKTDSVMVASTLEKPTGPDALHSAAKSKDQASIETDVELTHSLSSVSQVEIISDDRRQLDKEFHEELAVDQNTDPQSSRPSTNLSKINDSQNIREDTDYDFDGVDEIFKTPKAKNIMILSSPKSISLQKPASDSVELIHSTEFDFSANLDELFQTPQSEFISRRADDATPATATPIEALSPEEAFDMLVGRPVVKKSYARKTPVRKQELSPLKISNDPTLPKTDIEEWIDSVNDLLEDSENEDEISYLTATMDEISRDPLMAHSVARSTNANKSAKVLATPRDEFEMTIKEENEEEDNKANPTVLKDPLETNASRSLSPNISGICLLDHTSESIFSETLALSDDSSLKDTEKTLKLSDDRNEKEPLANNQKQLNVSQEDKARREIEEAFQNFEKQRKALDEKRLASTPEPKKPSISNFAQRRTMGNQPSDAAFDPKSNTEGLGESVNQTINFGNKKTDRISGFEFDTDLKNAESEMSLGKSLVSKEKFILENNMDQNSKSEKTSPEYLSLKQVEPEQNEVSSSCQVERELELVFENFEEQPELSEQRLVVTPEPKKIAMKDHRQTVGSALVPELKIDLQAAKAERELEVAFENFEEQPVFSEQRTVKTLEPKKVPIRDQEVKLDLQAAKAEREFELAFQNFEKQPEFSVQQVVKTIEPKKVALKDHRRTLGSALVPEVKLDLQAAKAARELELAFENFEEQPEFSEHREVKTPEPKKISLKDHRRTVGSALMPEVKLDLQAAKAERVLELAFENFEGEPEFTVQRLVKTPEPKKVVLKDHRRTLGTALVQELKIDIQAAKAERELELAFENFEEQPEFSEQRIVKTPEPKKVALKDHRRTLGSALVPEVKLDLQAAKAARELELAFENFEEQPEFSEHREVKTPEPKKIPLKDHRRTVGSALVPVVKLDLQAAKAERELELAFENFEEEPEFTEQRVVKTPEPKKVALKDHRRTLGTALVPELKLDIQAAKAERELELAFENFEEQPEFSEQRIVKTPEPKKVALKDHRRTLGSAILPEVKLDLQAAKAARELELAFENFEEQPEFSEHREVKTPEPKKIPLKDHRRTVGSALVPEVKLDMQAARDERELELAFENFEEEPEFTVPRVVKTPEPKKVSLKDHRRTLGTALVQELKLDIQAAKAARELELSFENFEEQPKFSEHREVKTPEPKKIPLKDHRRTVGSALVPEVKLDLQAAKAERELELAFENFKEEPEFTKQRLVKTPEPKKVVLKDHRRTLGTALVQELKLDIQAAKAERELELAFENFEEQPEFSEQRIVKTPEPKKVALKDHRRTLGSALVPEVKLDLQAAKAARELELAFENFEEQPEFSEHREVKTPEPKKFSLKDHRRTVGSSLVPEVKLNLQAAKAERELELAFENFEEEPEFTEQRVVKTPEPKKVALKDHRRTLGTALVPELKLDIQAAKAERELELAFENFEEQPEFSEQRIVKTPEPKKVAQKDHRRTLGSALVPEVKLDLQAAKAARELELAFENFEEQPEFSEHREVKTPEPKKISLKDHRRTVGSALVPEVKLNLQVAKAERELELAFENFEEQPEFSEHREVKTPEPTKISLKDHRRTVGSALVQELKLDLQAAKAERELEVAFENFEEQPEFLKHREVKTPESKKISMKDHRRTVGSALVQELKLDLQAAKAERELEVAFENFEEQPEFLKHREVKTPEPKKISLKDHRRTVGSALVQELKLDLQAAKAERELEVAFENFEEQPEFLEHREVKTPEPTKIFLKDHRRTVGSALVQELKLDLQAAKAERELEVAFENFEEQPEFSEHREVKTPEPKKIPLKDHRRTVGSALVQELKLDLQAAKAERELEMAFENFEEQPEFLEHREVKTPEPKKISLKDHRRTVGSALVQEVKLDLQAAKTERELELAFENFEEEPEFTEQRVVKTPELKKVALKDHRRTLGSALVQEVKIDLQAAKTERELELAFENFEEEPEFTEQRVVKTPEPKKISPRDHRRTVGSALVQEVKLDLQAAKTERELELAFENFEEEPESTEQRVVETLEPKKIPPKDHRRAVGSSLVQEVKQDLQAAKAELELEVAFENFEEQPVCSEQRTVKTPETKKVPIKDQKVKLDLQAAKAERELELAIEKFEEQPEFSEQREVKTPEPIEVYLKVQNALVSEGKHYLQARKTDSDLDLDKTSRICIETMNVTLRPQRKRQEIISEVETAECAMLECTELETKKEQDEEHPLTTDEDNTHTSLVQTMESGSNILVDLIAAKNKAIEEPNESYMFHEGNSMVKKEMELENVKKDISANNEEQQIQKPDNDFIRETIRSYEHVASTPTRSLRRRRNTTDEDEKLKPHPIATGQQETVNNEFVYKNEIEKTPVLRRTRKKTIENLDDLKASAAEETSVAQQIESHENSRQMRRTRQNSVDSFTDDTKSTRLSRKDLESLPQMRRTRQNSADSFTDDTKSTRLTRKDLKASNNEDEPIKTTNLRIDSTDVDSTEDEAAQTSKNTRKKRIRKIASKTSETPLKDTDLHILEPIDEEGINSESKIINQDIEAKSLLSLRAEADEFTSLSPIVSQSRIRGRKAQLNVVLIESNAANASGTGKDSTSQADSVKHYIETHEDGNSKEECSEKNEMTNDADESIPSTPLPLSSRGRRPSKPKVPSNLVVPALRKTRRGSVQEDIEVPTVVKVEAAPNKNDSPSKSNVPKDDSEPSNDIPVMEVVDEDIVPSTPVDKKTRRRQLPNKQKTSPKTFRKVSGISGEVDPENITKVVELKEMIVQNEIEGTIKMQGNEEATETENSMQKQENFTLETDNVTSKTVPSKNRGRRAILKHEIVRENVTSVHAQTTTEDIVPHKQIISTEEESGLVASDTSKICEAKSVSENNISEGIQTKSPPICDEKIISVKQQDSTLEASMKNLEFASIEVEKAMPTSPVLSKTRGRRAASKVQIEPDRSTPTRRVGRPKKTNLQTKEKVEIQEKDTQDDERNSKVLEYSSSDNTNIFTSTEIQNQTPAGIQNNTPQITSNRRVGRRKAIEKTVLGKDCTDETPCGEDNSNNDAKAVEVASSDAFKSKEIGTGNEDAVVDENEIPSKTRGRRAAMKTETEVPAVKRGRKRAAEQTSDIHQSKDTENLEEEVKVIVVDDQDENGDNVVDGEKITTPVLTKKRGRKAAAKIEPAVPTPVIANPKTTSCTEETQSRDDSLNDHETIAKVVENNIPSKTRGRRAAVKPENVVPTGRSGRKRDNHEIISKTQQLQGTENHKEEMNAIVHDCQHDSTNQEEENGQLASVNEQAMTPEQISDIQQLKDTENHEEEVKVIVLDDQLYSRNQDENADNIVDGEKITTPVLTKKRGRKAAAKIEPAAPTPVIATPTKTTALTEETQSRDDGLNDLETIAKVSKAPSPDVFKSQEIKKVEAVVGNSIPSKTRGRKAALKPENVVPTGRRGPKRANHEIISETQQLQGTENHEEEINANVQDCQHDSTNQEEEKGQLASVNEQTMTPVPAKKRGRKAAVKIVPEVSTPAFATPVRRAGRRKLVEIPVLDSEKLGSPAESENEGNETKEVSIKNPTPVRRGARRNIPEKVVDVQKSPNAEELTTEVRKKQDDSAKLSPTPSKTVGSKVLPLTSKSEGLVIETSTPIRRGGRTKGARNNVENTATESNIELPKSRGRRGNQKIEENNSKRIEHITELIRDEDKLSSHTAPYSVKLEPLSAENSPSVKNTRQKRPAVREESKDLTIHTHNTAFKKETEALNESLTTDTDNHENSPATKRTRRAPAKLTEFIVSDLVQQVKTKIVENKSDGAETEVHNPAASKKRGQPVSVKFDNMESTQEDSTPPRKRGRRAIVKNDDHKESGPLRRVGRQGKAKNEEAVALIQGLQKDDNKHNTSTELVSDEEKPEEISEKRTTSTLPVSEEQQTQIEVRTQNKPTRGRGKAPLKLDSTLESTSHTDDEQSASTTKPKSNRGRKAATKSDPEKEIITQKKISNSEKPPNTKSEISHNEDKVDENPKRGRKAAKADPVDNSPVTTKLSPVTKKTTRGRKAAVKNDDGKSDDQSFQLDVQTTRSGKEQDKDAKPVSRRRNLEKLTTDDQQDTPSKRTRRKPNKLLSDDFIT